MRTTVLNKTDDMLSEQFDSSFDGSVEIDEVALLPN